ncbi:DUF4129 domain-containing protein [Spiractinospora alimapuensis]|uniref:DUF4129 domain-containing protein n=1 Tax=Spiractinospora alimapuensis TaxID=2820884 RepID=UPI001F48967F|nr:DUF4129 domain-containing protein [Spiractinospora alimapuensis]QVQ54363.1 DUF4129 domain-containing protein [Spiractinospora alimapuensis]
MTPPLGLHVDRDTADRLAREELSKPEYAEGQPSLIERLWRAFWEWVDSLLSDIAPDIPGSVVVGLVLLVLAIAVVVLVIYLRPARRARGAGLGFDVDAVLSAAEHRRLADERAAAGDHADAIRERLRAINQELEDQVILSPRPGRTATEIANEAAESLGDSAAPLHEAARVFNDVWYGTHPATAEGYQTLVSADEAVQHHETSPEPHRTHS